MRQESRKARSRRQIWDRGGGGRAWWRFMWRCLQSERAGGDMASRRLVCVCRRWRRSLRTRFLRCISIDASHAYSLSLRLGMDLFHDWMYGVLTIRTHSLRIELGNSLRG
jgi:hypothetical protein